MPPRSSPRSCRRVAGLQPPGSVALLTASTARTSARETSARSTDAREATPRATTDSDRATAAAHQLPQRMILEHGANRVMGLPARRIDAGRSDQERELVEIGDLDRIPHQGGQSQVTCLRHARELFPRPGHSQLFDVMPELLALDLQRRLWTDP